MRAPTLRMTRAQLVHLYNPKSLDNVNHPLQDLITPAFPAVTPPRHKTTSFPLTRDFPPAALPWLWEAYLSSVPPLLGAGDPPACSPSLCGHIFVGPHTKTTHVSHHGVASPTPPPPQFLSSLHICIIIIFLTVFRPAMLNECSVLTSPMF